MAPTCFHVPDRKYAYAGHQLHITATNSIYCHYLHNWTGCKLFPDNGNVIWGMEYGSVLTCTIVGIKQRDTIHHWRHRWIEVLIVLDIIYHLLKTQSRVGTQAILSTWTSYFCILRLDSGYIIPTSYHITICRTSRAGQRAWLPLASMPLINQGGRYKSDSNITGAIGPTFQCIFNIFLFSNIYHVKKLPKTDWICLTT